MKLLLFCVNKTNAVHILSNLIADHQLSIYWYLDPYDQIIKV